MTRGETQQNATPKKRRKAKWENGFLGSLRKNANVTAACDAAKIERSTAYRLRERAGDFKASWDDALEQACDLLELEARRRAEDGVEKTIFYKGEPIGREINYSDTLMIFLLKAHRPETYRERLEVMGKDGGAIRVKTEKDLTDDELAAIAANGK